MKVDALEDAMRDSILRGEFEAALNSTNAANYRLYDPAGTGTFVLGWNGTDQLTETFSQKLLLAGNWARFKWTAELYYTR